MQRPRRLSLAWLAASFLFLAGGFLITAISAPLFDFEGAVAPMSLLFVGTVAGGFLSCASHPERRIVETILAAALLSAVLFLVERFMVDSPWLLVHRPAELRDTLQLGFLSSLGGLIGAVLGERHKFRGERLRRTREWLVTFFATMGVLFLTVTAVAWLEDAWFLEQDLALAFALALVFLTPVIGGFVSQLVVTRKAITLCSAGCLPLSAIIVVSAGVRYKDPGLVVGLIIGFAILSLFMVFLGSVGAYIGWSLSEGRRTSDASEASLPPARVM